MRGSYRDIPAVEIPSRPSRFFCAQNSTLSTAADAPDAPISARTCSHTQTCIQIAESTHAENLITKGRARLARQDAMSAPLRPLTRSARALLIANNSPAAAMGSTAHQCRGVVNASSPRAALSSSSHATRSMSRQQAEGVSVPQTPKRSAPSVPVQRKRTRDDDDEFARQARHAKKTRNF